MPYIRKTFDCVCGKRTSHHLGILISGAPRCPKCVEGLDDLAICEGCDSVEYPDLIVTDGDKQVCRKCYEASLVHCVGCNAELETDYMGRTEFMVAKEHFCEECYRDNFIGCNECGEILDREGVDTRDRPDNTLVCRDCFDETCCHCDECDTLLWLEDARGDYSGDTLCPECYSAHGNDYYWNPGNFNPDGNSFRRIGSRRHFGIELEYNSAPRAVRSVDALRHFGRKDEHCGVEFYSTILHGDRGLSTVEDLATFAEDNNWSLNRNCGYHLHLDLRNENMAAIQVLAYAYRKTYETWARFIDDWRRNRCSFAHAPNYSSSYVRGMDERSFRHFLYDSARYNGVNWNAYGDHTTVEVRMHYATRDAAEITNWVKAHARFVDWGLQQSFESVDAAFNGDGADDFAALTEVWSSPSLTTYYRNRARACGQAIPARQSVVEAV